MSHKDKELLEVAGLTVAAAATIISRTRAAVYSGIADRRRYFSAPQLLAMIQFLRIQDSVRLRPFLHYLEEHYLAGRANKSDRNFVLPVNVGLHQIVNACSKASDILIVLSDNSDFAEPKSYFRSLLYLLLEERQGDIDVIAPHYLDPSARQKIEQAIGKSCMSSYIYTAPLPIILLKIDHLVRGFMFSNSGPNELEEADAKKLWRLADQYAPS